MKKLTNIIFLYIRFEMAHSYEIYDVKLHLYEEKTSNSIFSKR